MGRAIISRLERDRFRFFHRDLDYPAAGHSVGLVIPNLALVSPRAGRASDTVTAACPGH